MKDLCFKVESKAENKGANSNGEIVDHSKQEVLFGSLRYSWYPNIPLEVATTDRLLVKFKVGSETGSACNPAFPFFLSHPILHYELSLPAGELHSSLFSSS